MRDIKAIREEICELQKALTASNWELNRIKNKNMWLRQAELLALRAEIYKSICHRQSLIIQMLEAEVSFEREAA